jgi:SAM-dependent methyltransferase
MTKQHELYTPEFYAAVTDGSVSSARVVVPLVRALLRPVDVIDVGCGAGAWALEFRKHGIPAIGVDFMPQLNLLLSTAFYHNVDLTQPFMPSKDLAVCLEVAEHLPARYADTLVRSLCWCRRVLFSAAVPGQGGTGHVNEQPHEYWHAKFAALGFACFDVLRPLVAGDDRVSWWYRNNMFVYGRMH